MPDTDDDLSVDLDPEQREQGDDDTEASRERRAAQARAEADKDPTHDLDDVRKHLDEEAEAAALLDEEDAAAREERLELAAKDQRALEEHRDRTELLDATAETTRAMNLAYADEAARDRYRQYGANDKQRGLSDRAHGRHELDEAAANPDEPGAAALTAEGRRFQNAATIEERKSTSDYARAEAYDESAREHRQEARDAQPNATEAVRRPPEEAPEAQLPQARRHIRRGHAKVRNQQGKPIKPNRAGEPDLEL